MNKIILMGRLTADPELRHSQNGTVWLPFCIAVDRRGAAEGQQQADFINCTAFNKTAEFIAKYFAKGKLIAIEGSLQSRTYEDNGKNRTAHSVNVWQVYFTGDRNNESEQPSDSFVDLGGEADESDLPF